MTKREEIVELAGQIINGIFSSDGTILSKLADYAAGDMSSKRAVDIAIKMSDYLDEKLNNQ